MVIVNCITRKLAAFSTSCGDALDWCDQNVVQINNGSENTGSPLLVIKEFRDNATDFLFENFILIDIKDNVKMANSSD